MTIIYHILRLQWPSSALTDRKGKLKFTLRESSKVSKHQFENFVTTSLVGIALKYLSGARGNASRDGL